MPNGTYGGVRGKETKVGQKTFVSRPTRCGVFGVSFVFCGKKVVERPFFDDYLLNLHRENMHLRSENHAMCVHVADL